MVMPSCTSAISWARATFGSAQLGDPRRTRRLIQIASSLSSRPAGTITSVFEDAAEREGAYRFLQSPSVSTVEIMRARDTATIAECIGEGIVYVAVDGSSLGLTDRNGARDVGGVGAWSVGGRGLLVTTALAVSKGAVPLGVCGQHFWARERRATTDHKSPQQAVLREINDTVLLVHRIAADFSHVAPRARPWFQLDRGYDAQLVLRSFVERGLLFTVRASHDRRLFDGGRRYISDALAEAQQMGVLDVHLPRRDSQDARLARVTLKSVVVDLSARITKTRITPVRVTIVHAHEHSPPDGVQPLSWTLLTSAVVKELNDAREVIEAYKARWTVEELHRTWKSGLCNIEDTQLRSREALLRWATISCAVAARANRLARLARETPDVPASTEFSDDEIKAVVLLKSRKKRLPIAAGSTPSLNDVVRWIADLGGYTGKSSGGPPGPIVISRGLARVEPVAQAIAVMRRDL